MTERYVQLIEEYKAVAQDETLTLEQKAERSKEISEKMSQIDGEKYLNDDYNSCMRESNAQQDKDYNRCDRNGGNDKCYDRADRNAERREDGCERVSHVDNIANTVQSYNDKGGSSSCRSGGSSKKSGGHINAADRRR